MNNKLKSSLKIIAILIGIYIAFSLLCSLTGFLKMFRNSSSANEPNLPLNNAMFISNLPTAEKGDFVCYSHDDRIFGKHTRIHRLMAEENDTIQIINGNLHVNRVNVDQKINLMHFYKISKKTYLKIKETEKIQNENPASMTDPDSAIVVLEDAIAKKFKLESGRMLEPINKPEAAIWNTYKINWNKDNFGPLIIPKGKIFVLGDNRDNSEDSRHIGLIDQSAIVGVLLNN